MPPSLTTSLLPSLIDPPSPRAQTAVILDILRASTTIVHALGAGAAYVRPFLEPGEALAAKAAEPQALLGGERGGARIPGFDLGNSPAEYTPGRVAGRPILFTTTNGTRALLACLAADRILIGCFNNLGAIANQLVRGGRPIHLVCAGTRGSVSLEDVLCAGAIADAIRQAAPSAPADDATILAIDAWRSAGSLPAALRRSLGGRDVTALGLEADIAAAAAIDSHPIIPELDKATMRLTAPRG